MKRFLWFNSRNHYYSRYNAEFQPKVFFIWGKILRVIRPTNNGRIRELLQNADSIRPLVFVSGTIAFQHKAAMKEWIFPFESH